MVTVKACSPQQGMRRPSAPDNPGLEGGDEDRHGMMEKAEPMSTRYRRLDELSVMKKRRPGRTAETTPRSELGLLAEFGVIIEHRRAQAGRLLLASLAEVDAAA